MIPVDFQLYVRTIHRDHENRHSRSADAPGGLLGWRRVAGDLASPIGMAALASLSLADGRHAI
jgi:hypothetical protein